MAEKQFILEIITPKKVVYSADVNHVKAPGKEGYFGVKWNHTPYLTTLKIGKVYIDTGKEHLLFSISGGLVEVNDNKMTILAETAENAALIDVERASHARDRAQKRLQEKNSETNMVRAKAALLRAINRLEAKSTFN